MILILSNMRFNIMQSDRVWVGDKLSFELAGDTLTCSLHEDNEERTVVMQKMYSF
jgi:hypothetical protein